MAFPARRLVAPRRAVTAAEAMRLARFPAIRREMSHALAQQPIQADITPNYVRFRLKDPNAFHPALFAVIRAGGRGTLIVIGTRKAKIADRARLEAFIRRMGWTGKGWSRTLSTLERRSMIYQLRKARVIGGSEAQSVLVPIRRVEAAAAKFRGSIRRTGTNPLTRAEAARALRDARGTTRWAGGMSDPASRAFFRGKARGMVGMVRRYGPKQAQRMAQRIETQILKDRSTWGQNPLTREESAELLRSARMYARRSRDPYYSPKQRHVDAGVASGRAYAAGRFGPRAARRPSQIIEMRALGFAAKEYRKDFPTKEEFMRWPPRTRKNPGGLEKMKRDRDSILRILHRPMSRRVFQQLLREVDRLNRGIRHLQGRPVSADRNPRKIDPVLAAAIRAAENSVGEIVTVTDVSAHDKTVTLDDHGNLGSVARQEVKTVIQEKAGYSVSWFGENPRRNPIAIGHSRAGICIACGRKTANVRWVPTPTGYKQKYICNRHVAVLRSMRRIAPRGTAVTLTYMRKREQLRDLKESARFSRMDADMAWSKIGPGSTRAEQDRAHRLTLMAERMEAAVKRETGRNPITRGDFYVDLFRAEKANLHLIVKVRARLSGRGIRSKLVSAGLYYVVQVAHKDFKKAYRIVSKKEHLMPNPLTRMETASLVRRVRDVSGSAQRAKQEGRIDDMHRHIGYMRGMLSAGQRFSERKHLVSIHKMQDRLDRIDPRISSRMNPRTRRNPILATLGIAANPNPQGLRIPFRAGQKVTVEAVRRWLASIPDAATRRALTSRFEANIRQYKRFHLGSTPKDFTFQQIPLGTSQRITDVDFVTSEGKEWAAPYQVPPHSKKYTKDTQGRYLHAHGESGIDIKTIKRPAKPSKLPERFHTADGKFVGVVPSRNVKITDWYRG